MFKNFLKKVEEKGKGYTKKTKDYVESEEFKNRVDSIKNKTTAVAKDLESKGKKAVSDFKEKQKSDEVVETTEESTVVEKEDGVVVEEKEEKTVTEKEGGVVVEEKEEKTVTEKEDESVVEEKTEEEVENLDKK
jgi:uncharacterized protein (DUF849 family)